MAYLGLGIPFFVGLAADIEPSDPIAGRAHWAFQPLREPAPPADFHPPSAIDGFLDARRFDAGLAKNPPADRRTWLRRVTFQITGLPPSVEEVEAFESDPRPDARERVVDRLLRSPAYGERWGRHWLDLARYADSNGLDENFLFREAWRYRNWVIAALNQDMPFDRFVLEQIAGDLIPFDSVEQRDRQRVASGFLVMGPKVLLGVNPDLQRMDVADEQLRTIGRTFLGLTLGCARCHDHKFEPIPTADYYAMAGIFTSTQVVQQRYMLGQQRVMERLVGLGPNGDQKNAEYETYWRELPGKRASLERARKAKAFLEKEEEEEFQKLLKESPGDIAQGAADQTLTKEERLLAQEERIASLDKIVSAPLAIPPRAMIPADVDVPADTEVRLRGAFNRKAALVPRGFLTALSHAKAEIADGASGRVELARWLVDVEDGAGALTARVMANRVWAHMTGSGIVRTLDNFGRTGETPSHPVLLDYLATRYIDSGWSLKGLIREIALSDAFGLSSAPNPAAQVVDPENRFVWRGNQRRLEPEALRDRMLTVAGLLDRMPLDSTVHYLGDQATAVGANKNRRRTDYPNRSVYLPVIRNDLPELFQAFDFADPHSTTGVRPVTNAVTQSLFMLNDATVVEAAEALASRALAWREGSDDQRVRRLMECVLLTEASDSEIAATLSFLIQTTDRLRGEGHERPRHQAWSLVAQAIFASSRFQLLD